MNVKSFGVRQAMRAFMKSLAVVGLAAMLLQGASAQIFTVLYTFGAAPDGSSPYDGLIRDRDGNMYGTTSAGGRATMGVIFKIDPSGVETILHDFESKQGGHTITPLLLGDEGDLYGTCTSAAFNNFGSVFRLGADGQFKVLYKFDTKHNPQDGYAPYTGLTMGTDGDLYGTTSLGGKGLGTIYKINHKTGQESELYGFSWVPDGVFPDAPLLRDAAGNLYGTAAWGGMTKQECCGTIYKLDPNGIYTVLYTFTGLTDGQLPNGNLAMDEEGNLYGATVRGGTRDGTIFKLDMNGQLTTLYTFHGGDGAQPEGGVARDHKGNLYGVTSHGGSSHFGTVYKLDPSGTLTQLHSFTLGDDGGYPYGHVLVDESGTIYGTTFTGGDPTCECGVVWKITP